MTAMLIAWALMTVPVWLLGTAIVDKTPPGDTSQVVVNSAVSAVMFVAPWWALYFLIREFLP